MTIHHRSNRARQRIRVMIRAVQLHIQVRRHPAQLLVEPTRPIRVLQRGKAERVLSSGGVEGGGRR